MRLGAFANAALGLALLWAVQPAFAQQQVTRYVRYAYQGAISYGELEGETIYQLEGDIFSDHRRTGKTVRLSEVRLLAPVEPSKVICVGLNYRSHLGDREPAPYPGLFAKYPTSIIGPEEAIVMPPDASDLHYEGELVVVIGKRAKNVSVEDAPEYIFGVTAGNDVSERVWQRQDLQWLRAKASDTFAPIGPVIARGLNYNDLLVQTRVNGEVRQSERTKDLIFDIPTLVSYISRYVTLLPGDVIFTGTPQTTRAMRPGDVVEVEVEGVGVLRNRVVAAGSEPDARRGDNREPTTEGN
ncbi:Homoprotocatechuate catabolism bifunctional isomerase/decarboxylase [bacterium HR33]|nr:Homoprotocatechuate catabolism bifunctional isomerase/decarboxylase [bacterium HR33]